MLIRKYEIGQRIGSCIYNGNSHVVTDKKGHKYKKAEFICNCGNKFISAIGMVKKGHTKSCGCLSKERSSKSNFIDIIGKRYGRLVVFSFFDVKNKNSRWLCKCDCGKEKVVTRHSLSSGHTKSCGCLSVEALKNRSTKHGHAANNNPTSEYTTWNNMKARCYNENDKHYSFYGGRGIKVCERWLGIYGFENFIKDMGFKPTSDHTIDRWPNNTNGNYGPSNCRWATQIEQCNNVRDNKILFYNGRYDTLPMWCRELNLKPATVRLRLSKGYSVKQAIETPKSKRLFIKSDNFFVMNII